jgi:hypothetical protein
MQATLGGGTAPGYVSDTSPTVEAYYHARFYFNPHGANPGSGQVTIFSGLNASNATLFQVQLRKSGSNYQLRGAVLNKGTTTYTNWFTISNNAAHAVEIAWSSATSSFFQFYTDGALKQTLSNLNTAAYSVETVRLGPSAGLTGTTSGSLYFDSFVSTRSLLLGLNGYRHHWSDSHRDYEDLS